MDEEWKNAHWGREGMYQVSSHGRVKKTDTGIIMRQREWNGYMHVHLRHKGFKRKFTIHRLVAIAFLENPESKEFVNHIDRDRKNNHVKNLEWVTPGENTAHWMGLESGGLSDMPF